MKPAKQSVAIVIRGAASTFLVVKRPDYPDDALAKV